MTPLIPRHKISNLAHPKESLYDTFVRAKERILSRQRIL